ncbi:hypothetical protein EYF80_066515 [Liparis tanakae]|uniref:Uncharacterized protein n=1 Tax=Liparis tanakae TaxID=230148 RepID=A0A4Z2E377_9TELE|nr:hypothetical protein EYF80_066515 [Liparis tanakae]
MSVLQCASVALKAAVRRLDCSRQPAPGRLHALRQQQMLETLECLLQMGSHLHATVPRRRRRLPSVAGAAAEPLKCRGIHLMTQTRPVVLGGARRAASSQTPRGERTKEPVATSRRLDSHDKTSRERRLRGVTAPERRDDASGRWGWSAERLASRAPDAAGSQSTRPRLR